MVRWIRCRDRAARSLTGRRVHTLRCSPATVSQSRAYGSTSRGNTTGLIGSTCADYPGCRSCAHPRNSTLSKACRQTRRDHRAVMSADASVTTWDIRMPSPPRATDRAIIDWERSDDGGASWRVIAHIVPERSQCTALRHGQASGALERAPRFHRHRRRPGRADSRARLLHAARPTAAPPCVTGPATRINVLQQSALPAIVDRAALRAGSHRADGQLLGHGLRPARAHAAMADTSRQLERRVEQCHHRHRRHDR